MAKKATNPIPQGYHSVTPYLICKGAGQALDWYKKAFGGEERFRVPGPGGQIMHAELQVGDSVVMMADEFPEMGAKSPQSLGGTPVGLCIYTADCDAVFNRAVGAGAKVERPLQDQFYGDRSGTLVDPWGHKWTVATHIEDLTPQEIDERQKKFMAQQAQQK